MKNWIKVFLEKLAKSNEESFKGQRVDCCTLNRKNEKSKTDSYK